MDDYTVEFFPTKDTSDYDRFGNIVRVREYKFYIGKHGPFIERVPLVPFDPNEIHVRVNKLRTEVQNLPK